MRQYSKSLYVFACISKIAEKVASTEFLLSQVMNSQGDLREIKTHPILDLLYRPNKYMSKSEFFELLIIHLRTTGNAFIAKIRNEAGQVMELWPLRPDMVTIITDPRKFIKYYQFITVDGNVVNIEPSDIIHHKYSDPINPYYGLSPMLPCQPRVQTEEYATNFQRDFFLNSARPDAVLKQPAGTGSKLTPDQKEELRRSFEKAHRGLGKNSKVAILEGGLEYQLISISQKEMDFIESMRFTRDDILVAFKVPKPIIAIVDDVNRANSETALAIFLGETIKPEVDRLVEKMQADLIDSDYGPDFVLGYVDPTPENKELKLAEYQNGLQNGWLLINEVREMEGRPPVTGGWQLYLPFGVTPVGGIEPKAIGTIGGKTRDEAIGEREVKRFDFKGKHSLYQKFLHKEMIEKTTKEIKEKMLKTKKPLLTTQESKDAYADVVNKAIDSKAKRLSTDTTKFMDEQKKRVLEKFDSNVKSKRHKAIDLVREEIFNTTEENKLTMDFILPYIQNFLVEAGKESLALVAPQKDFRSTASIESYIRRRSQQFAKEVNNTTLQGLEDSLAEGINAGESVAKLRERVEAVYSDFPVFRSDMIARTESTASNNEGAVEGFKQSEVVNAKEWITSGDGRVRPEHQQVGGEIVGLDEAFSNGLKFPNEPNCRCVVGPAFLDE